MKKLTLLLVAGLCASAFTLANAKGLATPRSAVKGYRATAGHGVNRPSTPPPYFAIVTYTNDMACTGIPSPQGDTGTYTPSATFHNWGTTNAASWSAHYLATGPGATYDNTVSGLHLASGSDTTVLFPSWHITVRGSWALACSVALSGDEDSSNNKFSVTRGINNSIKVLVAAAEVMGSYPYLQNAIRDSSNGMISTADFFAAQTYTLRRPDSLLAAGYKAILTFSDCGYHDATALGDTLAKFMELGGGVVIMLFGDEMIAGRYSTEYMPVLVSNGSRDSLPDSLGTVYYPESPIMQGVTSLGCGEYDGGDTSVRSNSNVERIADWSDGHVECATFDSSGVRTAYLGFFPVQEIGYELSGSWVRQIDNALLWVPYAPPVTGMGSGTSALANRLTLAPNPFSNATTISYSLPRVGNVSLKLYDVTGKFVTTLASGHHTAGTSSFIVHRSLLSPGVYVLKLETGNSTATTKLIIE